MLLGSEKWEIRAIGAVYTKLSGGYAAPAKNANVFRSLQEVSATLAATVEPIAQRPS
jgi:hypothetical protein